MDENTEHQFVYAELAALGMACDDTGHVFAAPTGDAMEPIIADASALHCLCGEYSHADILRRHEAAERDEEALISHATKWGSRHRVN